MLREENNMFQINIFFKKYLTRMGEIAYIET